MQPVNNLDSGLVARTKINDNFTEINAKINAGFTSGQLLIGNAAGGTSKSTITAGAGITVENGDGNITISAPQVGTVTSVNASGGSTGLTFSGGPITTSGTLTLGGTLGVANGGTGVTTSTGTGSVVLNNNPTFSEGAAFNGNVTVSGASVTAVSLVATGEVMVGNNSGDALNAFRIDGFNNDLGIIAASAVGAAVGTSISFRTAPAGGGELERMRIDASGNVGIGTTTAVEKVTLNQGNYWALRTGGAKLRLADQNNEVSIESLPVGVGSEMVLKTNTVERMRIDGSGNVGIGTNLVTPVFGRTLQIGSGDQENTVSLVGSTSAGFMATFQDTFHVIGRGGAHLVLGAGELERMRITSAGNVGIGTTNPQELLELSSNENPKIRFVDIGNMDAKIGIVGSTALGFEVAGAERLRLDSFGNVGIGTSSPQARLHVEMPSVANTTTLAAAITDGTLCNFQVNFVTNADLASSLLSLGTASGALAFDVAGVRRMRIDSSGNVGIGTTAPAYKLDIAAHAIASGVAGGVRIGAATDQFSLRLISATTDLGVPFAEVRGPLDGNGWLGFSSGSAAAERMRITATGNVGIGTSSPSATLHVSFLPPVSLPALGSGVGGVAIGPAMAYGMLAGTLSSGSGYIQQQRFDSTSDTYPLLLQPNGGDVGIGTSSPGARLDVRPAANNIMQVKSASHSTLTGLAAASTYSRGNDGGVDLAAVFGWNTGGLAMAGREGLAFATGGATNYSDTVERMRIDSGGNVGIGTTTASSKLTVLDGNSNTVATFTCSASPLSLLRFTHTTDGGVYYGSSGTSAVIYTNGVERFSINSTGGITSANLADAVGYKGLPQTSGGSGYTLALTDQGRHVTITGGVTIPANSSVAFPIGTIIVVFNDSASTQTIAITADTLRLAGTTTTGTRTLAAYGLCTLVKVGTTTWVATGDVT